LPEGYESQVNYNPHQYLKISTFKNSRWRTAVIITRAQQLLRWATVPQQSGRKVGKGAAVWTETYLRTKWHLDPSSHFATTDMGRGLHRLACVLPASVNRENGGLLCLLSRGGGAGSPSNTMWPEPRPTYVPRAIYIHPSVWT